MRRAAGGELCTLSSQVLAEAVVPSSGRLVKYGFGYPERTAECVPPAVLVASACFLLPHLARCLFLPLGHRAAFGIIQEQHTMEKSLSLSEVEETPGSLLPALHQQR